MITCKSLMAMMLSVQQLDDSVYDIASTMNTKMDNLYAEICSRLDTKENHDAVAAEEVQKNIVVASEEQKEKVLHLAKKLEEKGAGVRQQDLTPLQSEK